MIRAYLRAHWHALALGAAAVAVILGLVAHCAPGPTPPSAPTQHLNDSLVATAAADAAARAALHATAALAQARAEESRVAAQQALARALGAEHRADALKAALAAKDSLPVTPTDSLAGLVRVVATQDTALVALHAVIAHDTVAQAAQDTALRALVADTVTLATRLAATQRLADRWRSEFTAAAQCRFLFLPCPSRGQAFAYGTVAGALAVLVIRR